jgi:O-antigen/teichoic acid export membrane protein
MENNLTQDHFDSIKVRATKGGFWVLLLRILQKVFKAVQIIILARLLDPKSFGLMGIALLTISIIEHFSCMGFDDALIHKKGKIASYLDIVWTILVIRGVVLFGLIYHTAPAFAAFFENSQAALIIQVFGLTVLLKSLTNIGTVYFYKEINFKKEFVFNFIGVFAEFVAVIYLALLWRNIWALAVGIIINNLSRLLMSYVVHPYRPKFKFELSKAKELLSYGKWVFGATILFFVLTQADDIFVGRVLGTVMLGFYQLAYRISNLTSAEIIHVISLVSFPVYSKLQKNIELLNASYKKIFQIACLISFPISGLLVIMANELTIVLLGAKWEPIIPLVIILSIAGLIKTLSATTKPVFLGLGKPDIITKVQSGHLLILAGFIYPFTKAWGISGTALAVLLGIFCEALLYFVFFIRLTKVKITDLWRTAYPELVAVIVMGIFIRFIFKIVIVKTIPAFLLVCFLAAAVYIAVIFILDKFFNYNILASLKKYLGYVKTV